MRESLEIIETKEKSMIEKGIMVPDESVFHNVLH